MGENWAEIGGCIFYNCVWEDGTPPTVIGYSYSNHPQTDIRVYFSEAMDADTIEENVEISGVLSGAIIFSGSYGTSDDSYTIEPVVDLLYGDTIHVTVGCSARDLASNCLAEPFTLSFDIMDEPISSPTPITLNATSNDLSIDPYQTIIISGTANYNTGDAVNGTATINTGDNIYTAAVIGGWFSRDVTGPSSSRDVTISVGDGTLIGNDSIYITVDANGSTPGYDLTTDIIYDYNYLGPDGGVEWWSKDSFRTDDLEVNLLALFENLNIDHDLDLMWRCFRPDGTQYGTDLIYDNAIEKEWGWGVRVWGWLIAGSSMAYNPGRYNIEFFVDGNRKATHDYVVGWEFAEHKMCKDVDESNDHIYVDPTNIFSPDDVRAVAWHEFLDRCQELHVKAEFYDPNGALYSAPEYTFDDLPQHTWWALSRSAHWIFINGHPPQYMCGDWTVKFYVQNPTGGNWEQKYIDIFRIEENITPTITSITASPSVPIETQSVTVDIYASDNNHLKKLVLHWNDGTEHTQPWDSINSGSTNKSHNIGSFSSGTSVEYWAEVWDESGNRSESGHTTIIIQPETVTPPDRPNGDICLRIGESGTYTTGGSTTNLGHTVQYQFDWGDATQSAWDGVTQSKSWSSEGYYFVKAHARCQTHANRESNWSSSYTVTVDSTNPMVAITTNGGVNFSTNEPQIILEGLSDDPDPSCGLASTIISTGSINGGHLSNWRFTVDLTEGPNILTITTTDNAGNVGIDTITVSYPIPTETNCSDSLDNDNDGFTDCADSDCNGLSCDDGNACTENDFCLGSCHPGDPIVCDDGNICTDDICNPATGCVYTNNTAPCDDSIFCNGTDTCSGGSCSNHTGNPCAPETECKHCQKNSNGCFDPPGSLCSNGECDGNGNCIPIECTNGQTRPCLNQAGVCSGSIETCTDQSWPGCDYTILPDYETTEASCSDGLDNDCDGASDRDDLDCSCNAKFVEDINQNIPNTTGVVSWGDYDNDGNIDLAMTGIRSFTVRVGEIYHNESYILNLVQNLTGVTGSKNEGGLMWVDYDGNGTLDLAYSGYTGENSITQIYKNNGNILIEDGAQSLLGVTGNLAWGDYDNDGDLDLALIGIRAYQDRYAKIYENQNGLLVEDLDQNLQGVSSGSVAWGDYDNDGDMDLALSGDTGTERITKIYNNENGTLSEDTSQSISGRFRSTLAWVDYDGDEDLELIVTGEIALHQGIVSIYKNQNGHLTEDVSQRIDDLDETTFTYGDYDNDGDYDFVLVGSFSGGIRFYKNKNGQFSLDDTQSSIDILIVSIDFGDYDNDGDLDLAISGTSIDVPGTIMILKNNISIYTPNIKPNPPQNETLNSELYGSNLTLSWGSGSDSESNSNVLTYNLRVGTTTGANDVVSGIIPPGPGNVNHSLTYTIKNLEPRTYFWSVQTIDTGFAKSEWATEKSFIICDVDDDCDDNQFCNGSESCVEGVCRSGTYPCADDGLFCNGSEGCDENSNMCTHSGNPCPANCTCNESNDSCNCPDICTSDKNCEDDGLFCNGNEVCKAGKCVHEGSPCPNDGLFCTGLEGCDEDNNVCTQTGNPCSDPTPICVEEENICVECLTNAECGDGLFCTGVESCDENTGACVSSGNPCDEREECVEETDECLPESTPPCQIVIDPESIELISGQTSTFIVKEVDEAICDDHDYEWSEKSTIGSKCDQSGNYTAGTNFDIFNPVEDTLKVIDHGNTDNEGKEIEATATITVFACPLVKIYGENSEEVKILRSLRDNVLSNSPEGQEIIKLYYQWSPAIVKAMEENEEFKKEMKAMVDKVLPLIKRQIE